MVEVGEVSAPLWGRRWWAERGGAWLAPHGVDGSIDGSAAERLRCARETSLTAASTIVIPREGMLLGWRNAVPSRFPPPALPRCQCFAIDAVIVAEGRLDASIIMFGGVWDFAPQP